MPIKLDFQDSRNGNKPFFLHQSINNYIEKMRMENLNNYEISNNI